MIGDFVIHNGLLCPPDAARFGLDDADITYGYGCYEVLKLRDGHLFFPLFHEERLLASASILGIEHGVKTGQLVAALHQLVEANCLRDSNLKVILVGHDGRPADWYAFQVPALYPPSGAHETGVACLLFAGERSFPAAKSLNMLVSTIAYRQAVKRQCYDALLVNQRQQVTEGSRTNIFWLEEDQADCLFTPPASQVLSGITRKTVIASLQEEGMTVKERFLSVETVCRGACSLMITSTSSTILPVRTILEGPGESSPRELSVSANIKKIQEIYKNWLAKNEIP